MQDQPLVTVILPIYNCEKELASCMESIFKQIYANIELLVVDQGSSDKSETIIRTYIQHYPYIRYYFQPKQEALSIPEALNKGLTEAKGEFIAFLKPSDRFRPEKIEQQVQAFQTYSSYQQWLAVIYSNTYFEISQENLLHLAPLKHVEVVTQFSQTGRVRWLGRYTDQGDLLLPHCLGETPIHLSTVLCRTAFLQEAGGFSIGYTQTYDEELWLRLLLKGYQFQYVDTCHSVIGLKDVPKHQTQERQDLIENIVTTYSIETLYPPVKKTTSPIMQRLAHETLGDALARNKLFVLAVREYEQALNHNANLYLKLAYAYLQCDLLEKAQSALLYICECPETSVQAYHLLQHIQSIPFQVKNDLVADSYGDISQKAQAHFEGQQDADNWVDDIERVSNLMPFLQDHFSPEKPYEIGVQERFEQFYKSNRSIVEWVADRHKNGALLVPACGNGLMVFALEQAQLSCIGLESDLVLLGNAILYYQLLNKPGHFKHVANQTWDENASGVYYRQAPSIQLDPKRLKTLIEQVFEHCDELFLDLYKPSPMIQDLLTSYWLRDQQSHENGRTTYHFSSPLAQVQHISQHTYVLWPINQDTYCTVGIH